MMFHGRSEGTDFLKCEHCGHLETAISPVKDLPHMRCGECGKTQQECKR
jgi:translation initiation factor 2 beta subunit (eIF-2beta)/eIF-5